ncbi:MAG TPA: energy-coupling factor transporter transmembrane component T [Solirubrobacterales bacterium]|nr:energy-coupling factor transporter transmembrane component T [Solirubrobacterales bacterium]
MPRRTRLGRTDALSATVYLGSLALIAFLYSNPIVLAAAGAGAVIAGLASRAGRALAVTFKWGMALGVFIVIVNGLVAQRGDSVVVNGLWLPLLGPTDVTAEALAEGAVLALRIVVVMMAFAVHSACVDPDRVLRMLRPLARRSALTATLISRLVPVAAADYARLGEAAALRGPAAAPVGRAALARRLVAGSLDRAVEIAATLELRGYALGAPGSARGGPRTRYGVRFMAAGLGIGAIGIAGRIAGVAGFDAYPRLSIAADGATLLLAAAIVAAALLPLLGRPGWRRP